MDRITDRALVEVRRQGADLVVVSATTPAERLLGTAHGTLVGTTWGPQFAAADAPFVLEGCRSVIDRRSRAWTGAAQPASRAGRRVHVTATRPPGSVGSRLQVELIEAAPHTPTVGSTETAPDPDEQWFARGLLDSARNPATARGIIATDVHGVITFFNPAAERMTGRRSPDVVGQVTPVVFHDARELAARAAELGTAPGYAVVLADVRADSSCMPRDWTYVRPGGERITVSTTSIALRDDDGEVLGHLTLAEDVTEARSAHRQLQEALAKERELVARLNAVDRAKNEFIAAVNHELRTPLTSILGYTDVLLDSSAGSLSPLQASMVGRVERNGRRLLKLVENLLTLSAVQADAFQVERRRLDLAGVVKDAVERSAPDLDAAGLEVTVDLGHDSSPVLGDETQLGRVVTSLVDNAITFTPPGGIVRVGLRHRHGETVLEVADTGVGIPVCDQADLFERFVRARQSRAREDQGLGLGLAVTRSIVSSHGGRVTLSSTPNVGTVVTVHLPSARDDRAELAAAS